MARHNNKNVILLLTRHSHLTVVSVFIMKSAMPYDSAIALLIFCQVKCSQTYVQISFHNTKSFISFRGLRPPNQGLSPWTPLMPQPPIIGERRSARHTYTFDPPTYSTLATPLHILNSKDIRSVVKRVMAESIS